MMGTLLATLLVMVLVVLAMSVGVLCGRRPIKGSCGGVGRALGEKDYRCEVCGGDESQCETGRRRGDRDQVSIRSR